MTGVQTCALPIYHLLALQRLEPMVDRVVVELLLELVEELLLVDQELLAKVIMVVIMVDLH